MISPARWAAFEALRRSSKDGGPDLASAIAATRSLTPDPRDRGLATELALMVERWRASLDASIEAESGRAARKIDLPALLSLRIALYQLRHHEKTPPHAVVNDAVEIVRKAGASRAAGFVNGVLRGLLRNDRFAGLPAVPVSDEDREGWRRTLAVRFSHPEWLVTRWLDRGGPQVARQWCEFNLSAAELCVRVNTRRAEPAAIVERLAAEGITLRPAPHAANAFYASEGNPMTSQAFHDGTIALMDEASQLVGRFGASVLGGRVLDACAAPGGKTLVLACDSAGTTSLIAADRRERRTALLRRSLDRYGLTGVPVVQHDLQRGLPFTDLDGIFVDAPCSGLGTVRRDPDIKWRRREEELAGFAAAQQEMLRQAAAAVRAGGRIVYSTCSSEPEENAGTAHAFLADHARFARIPAPDAFGPYLDDDGNVATRPDRHNLEMFFACAFQRVR